MKTPIGHLVMDFVMYFFDFVDFGVQMMSRILPTFINYWIGYIYNNFKGFIVDILEASDSRFELISNLFRDYFPLQYAWMSQKMNDISQKTRVFAMKIETKRQSLTSGVVNVCTSLKNKAVKTGHDVTVIAHPYVRGAAIISQPYVNIAKEQTAPIWVPLSEKAMEVNKRMKNAKYIGGYVADAESLATKVVSDITHYCLTDDFEAHTDTSSSPPSSISSDSDTGHGGRKESFQKDQEWEQAGAKKRKAGCGGQQGQTGGGDSEKMHSKETSKTVGRGAGGKVMNQNE